VAKRTRVILPIVIPNRLLSAAENDRELKLPVVLGIPFRVKLERARSSTSESRS